MTKRYKNKFERALKDAYWDGSDDNYEYSEPYKRFRRNKIDGVIGGVCSGIGDYLGIDPVIVRIITVVSLFTIGFTLVIYIAMWMLFPSDSRAPYRREYREARQERARAKTAYRKQSKPNYRENKPAAGLTRTTSFNDVKSKFRSLETRLQDLERSITSKEWQLRREFRDL